MIDYTPQEGDIMADDWIIPASGNLPFRIKGENEGACQIEMKCSDDTKPTTMQR